VDGEENEIAKKDGYQKYEERDYGECQHLQYEIRVRVHRDLFFFYFGEYILAEAF
jgi:hypothetical protein